MQGEGLPPVTSLLLYGLPLHARGDTLVVPAELASVPLSLVHQTVLVLTAGVGQLLANCSLEETLEIHLPFLLRSSRISQDSGTFIIGKHLLASTLEFHEILGYLGGIFTLQPSQLKTP